MSNDFFEPYKLRDGQKVEAIFWGDGAELLATNSSCELMEIRHVNGHMAAIPFVYVKWIDGTSNLYGVHQAQGIKLPAIEPTP